MFENKKKLIRFCFHYQVNRVKIGSNDNDKYYSICVRVCYIRFLWKKILFFVFFCWNQKWKNELKWMKVSSCKRINNGTDSIVFVVSLLSMLLLLLLLWKKAKGKNWLIDRSINTYIGDFCRKFVRWNEVNPFFWHKRK